MQIFSVEHIIYHLNRSFEWKWQRQISEMFLKLIHLPFCLSKKIELIYIIPHPQEICGQKPIVNEKNAELFLIYCAN